MIPKTTMHCYIQIYLVFYMFVHLIRMLLLSFLLIKLCFLIKIYVFIFIWWCFFNYNKNQFYYSYFFTANIINSVDSFKGVIHILG